MTIQSITALKSLTNGYLQVARRFSHNSNIGSIQLIRENNNNLVLALAEKKLVYFDIFLSHAFKDADIVAGIMLDLIQKGYTVYVDWIFDYQLSRESVNKSTADTLIKRLGQSRSLFYATTENSTHSKWMPWELGYKHGENGKCAIYPVKEFLNSPDLFKGQEYLDIYEKVVDQSGVLWICPEVNTGLSACKSFISWAGVSGMRYKTLGAYGI